MQRKQPFYIRRSVFRNPCPLLTLAIIAAALATNAAHAQVPSLKVAPRFDLTATMQPNPQQQDALRFDPRRNSVQVELRQQKFASSGDKLFNDPEPVEGGWKGLARLLEALTPGVDTALPLSSGQITSRISSMLTQGRNQEALEVIEKRTAQLQNEGTLGADVQLLFLHGRALAALGRHNEAISIYLDMTTRYPELPEPWNNLASEYVRQGKLEMARDALQMALTADPDYATAQANLGEVQLMLAQQSFEAAAQQGAEHARSRAKQTGSILKD